MKIYKRTGEGVEQMEILPHTWPVYERRGWGQGVPPATKPKRGKAVAEDTTVNEEGAGNGNHEG